jgi:hypothetical protein
MKGESQGGVASASIKLHSRGAFARTEKFQLKAWALSRENDIEVPDELITAARDQMSMDIGILIRAADLSTDDMECLLTYVS